jgi:hypothetical protein
MKFWSQHLILGLSLFVSYSIEAQEDPQKSSVSTSGGQEYRAGKFKRVWLGDHYRDSWTREITIPILDLKNTFGGITPYERGGGRQTTSLKFRNSKGIEYVFRSVNKDPSKAIAIELRESLIADLLQDQTSTQHPYGAVVASDLLDNTDILHARPVLYAMPDDPALGIYQAEFANLLGMLEERTIAGPDKIVSTKKIFHELLEKPNQVIDDNNFARARMFDILMGDWGKHEDNWKWGQYNEGKGKLFKPIPRDRDHVFSKWDGILPWLTDRKWAKPSGEHFDHEINDLKSLTWQSRHMDRFLGSQLTRQDWIEAAQAIQKMISNEKIDQAVKKLPYKVYEISGDEISSKLKSRLQDLPNYAEQYYELLSGTVDIVGTAKKERFKVSYNDDQSVDVTMMSYKKKVIYQRHFIADETDEIRLYGLAGEDKFALEGTDTNEILIRIIGGDGDDQIQENTDIQGKKVLVYDESMSTDLSNLKGVSLVDSKDTSAYSYDMKRFAYNTFFPIAYLSYNSDNGLGVSLGASFVNHKFGKPDFSSKHSFGVGATTESNFDFSYTGRFRYFIGKWDLEVNGVLGLPSRFENFFGLGNNSIKDEDLFGNNYYRSRFDTYQLGLAITQEVFDKNTLTISTRYENFDPEVSSNSFIATLPSDVIAGLNELTVVTTGFEYKFDLRDRAALPENGTSLQLGYHHGFIDAVGFGNGYDQFQGTAEYYKSTKNSKPFTLGLKVGGSMSSDEVPYFKRVYLGQNDNLHGFVKNRFTGKSNMFINSELRWQITSVRRAFVPFKFGVRAIFDAGRVFDDADINDNVHQGYGAGIYFVPVSEKFAINITAAFSEEESGLLLFTIGSYL